MTALVGVAEHYAQFVRLCKKRIEELSITYDTVDALCGFPATYTAALLCEQKSMSVYSFFTMARALALLPAFQHDEAQFAELRQREDWITARRAGAKFRGKRRSGGVVRFQNHTDFYRQIGHKGAIRANALRKRRKAAARKAARARWA